MSLFNLTSVICKLYVDSYRVAPMSATACCSLSRSLPGPWPGQCNFVLLFVTLVICYMHTLYIIINVAGQHGLNKTCLILICFVHALS